jgi:hypothetical protein
MSTYVREKVLRIPRYKLDFAHIVRKLEEKFPGEDVMDDLGYYIEDTLPDLFDYGTIGKFQLSPTYEPFIDYVLDYEYDADGEYGKTRALTENEKEKYLPVFRKIDPEINMDFVRLVEFCWYNGCEAPDYYDEAKDDFFDEV